MVTPNDKLRRLREWVVAHQHNDDWGVPVSYGVIDEIDRLLAEPEAQAPSEATMRAWAIKSDECDGYCNVLGAVAWDSKGLATAQHRYQNERVVEVEIHERRATAAPAAASPALRELPPFVKTWVANVDADYKRNSGAHAFNKDVADWIRSLLAADAKEQTK